VPHQFFVPFNYARAVVYGSELTINYKKGGFMLTAILRIAVRLEKIISSRNLIWPRMNWIISLSLGLHLDHDQTITGPRVFV